MSLPLSSLRRWFFFLCLFGVFFVLCLMFLAHSTIFSFKDQIISGEEIADTMPVALVFGGGMLPNGNMTPLQEYRVKKAIELFKAGQVERLLMTGDDGANRVDEVHPMHDVAVAAGVPDELVDIDPHGYNTRKSCERAHDEFGITSAVAISQEFHLPRIIYFCEHMGIDTVGVTADMPADPSWRIRLWTTGLREILARVKGFVILQIL